MNVIEHFDSLTPKFTICARKDNIPAIKTYQKVFGTPDNEDENYYYFTM